MAKKQQSSSTPAITKKPVAVTAAPEAAQVSATKPRNSSVPPKATGAAKPASARAGAVVKAAITNEMIAERAYHLWLSGTPGGETDHWFAAERELRGN